MIKLKNEFEIKKYRMSFRQIYRNNEFALYFVTQVHPDGTISTWFELHKIVVKQADIYHDDEYELLSGDELFGTTAWSCSNEGCVAKVININFPSHKLNERFKKYIVGSYTRNGEKMPKFELSYEQLKQVLTNVLL